VWGGGKGVRGMVTDSISAEKPLTENAADSAVDSPQIRKRRVRVRRKEEKFPRWVRAALWLGLPLLLWIAMYLIGSALL
jgi:hypothetical protein